MPIIVVHSLAISIHAPHEGVRLDFSNFPIRIFISIHAPHEGVRRFRCDRASIHYRFQSTHPTRGCDFVCFVLFFCQFISIHAPHEGVRRLGKNSHTAKKYFNPRTPRGGATIAWFVDDVGPCHFNPRTPRGGATWRRGNEQV